MAVICRAFSDLIKLVIANKMFLVLICAVFSVAPNAVYDPAELESVLWYWRRGNRGADPQIKVREWPPLVVLFEAMIHIAGRTILQVTRVLVSVETIIVARAGTTRTILALLRTTDHVTSRWEGGCHRNWTRL